MFNEREDIYNDNININCYNNQCDEAFGKAIRGEITMPQYREEMHRIDAHFSALFIER